jgi:GMP synthase (glutamine-hydrolysing)
MNISDEKIIILDFGSQYTQLIARKVRELGVYSEIVPYNTDIGVLQESAVRAIILSGGPSSIYEDGAPHMDDKVFELGKPVLGICYGLQHLAYSLNGKVAPSAEREYGRAQLQMQTDSPLFADVASGSIVWMSHGDRLEALPDDFAVIARTENSPIAAIGDENRHFYGIQFHPEVHHSADGKKILGNFLFKIASCKGNWTTASFIEREIASIREQVGDQKVICGLSGGVDSSVTAVLLHEAIGDQLHCIFVDNGLLRLNERENVEQQFRQHYHINLTVVDAADLFLQRLAGVDNPEKKRKIIGNTFIEVFDEEAKKLQDVKFLAQGTLYPDVIESVSVKGPSTVIKSHHNVGGLPDKMNLDLVEPLRELFKDEVRAVGRELRIDDLFIKRHPFPGPGLAVRVPGEITREKLDILRLADAIYIEELIKNEEYDNIWQAFSVLLPVRSVGVMGDSRTYEFALALRAVTSTDGMTADWYHMPHPLLARISNRIINEVKGINRVVYDISSKPPATIEWE